MLLALQLNSLLGPTSDVVYLSRSPMALLQPSQFITAAILATTSPMASLQVVASAIRATIQDENAPTADLLPETKPKADSQ